MSSTVFADLRKKHTQPFSHNTRSRYLACVSLQIRVRQEHAAYLELPKDDAHVYRKMTIIH